MNFLLLLNETRSRDLARFALTEGPMICGRSAECDVVLLDPSVSRRHAQLVVEAGCITVSDLRSRNGTFVDGERVDSAALAPGQILGLGKVSLRLVDRAMPDGSGDETLGLADLATGQRVAALTPAQRGVLGLLVQGLGEKQIASRLSISRHTVHTHLREIYRVFGVHSRVELYLRLRTVEMN